MVRGNISGVGRRGESTDQQVSAAVRDALRGFSGGLLFGIPLLYTMEVWSLGEHADAPRVLVGLLLSIVPVYVMVSTSGFRSAPDIGRLGTLLGTVEAVGLGLASTAVILLVLRRITLDTPLPAAVATLVYAGVPFSIGVAVAREVLSPSNDQSGDGADNQGASAGDRGTIADLGAAAIGAAFVSVTIAPTAEIPILSAGISAPWQAGIVAASLLISYAIVFVAGFGHQENRRAQPGVLQRPITETVVAYVVAILVSMALLLFFHNIALSDPWPVWVSRIVVLALPASIGGAAGRVAV